MNVSYAMPLLPRRRPPARSHAPGSDDESNSPSPLPLPLLSLALPNCRAFVCVRACYRQTSFRASETRPEQKKTWSDTSAPFGIKYSNTFLDSLDCELETNETFGEGTKLSVSNSTLVPNVELKLESEMDGDNKLNHTLSAACAKVPGPFLFFDFASLAGTYNITDRELQAQVGGHTESMSVVIEATHNFDDSKTQYAAVAELRGDTCTLSAKWDPSAEPAEQKVERGTEREGGREGEREGGRAG